MVLFSAVGESIGSLCLFEQKSKEEQNMWKKIANSGPVSFLKDLNRTVIEKYEREILSEIMGQEGFGQKICNIVPSKIRKVAFIVNGILRNAGGSTTILRLGTYLTKKGYEVTYLNYSYQSPEEARRNAANNLSGFGGRFEQCDQADPDAYDAVIATAWDSAYRLARFSGYKMYFVQDYEPYLANGYEQFLLAKATYELGAHVVSLGEWNLKQIRRECRTDSILDRVSFPYEPGEYSVDHFRDYRTYRGKKKIRIAVFLKEEGKRIPDIIQINLLKVGALLKQKGIRLEVLLFGVRSTYVPMLGKNLGSLSKENLRKLYQRCDFGMCASMTNLSLVPFEMIAMGLPLIEFRQGSFADFMPEEAAILVDYDYRTLADKITQYMEEPEKLEKMARTAYAAIKDLSWDKTGDEFIRILQSLTGKP